MESNYGFRSFSKAIESDPIGVLLAKWRRGDFMKLERLLNVAEVIESGSVARGPQIGPVRDVDLVVVFDSSEHSDYGITRGPGAPHPDDVTLPHPGPRRPSYRPGPEPAEPGTNLWTGIFGPATATVSVPLTFV
jgi:hypothetical protein